MRFAAFPACYATPADHYREMARRLSEDRDEKKHALRKAIERVEAAEASLAAMRGPFAAPPPQGGGEEPYPSSAGASEQFIRHTKAVEQFLSDLYCTMIDPLASGTMSVKEMTTALLKQAEADRESLAMLATIRASLTTAQNENAAQLLRRQEDVELIRRHLESLAAEQAETARLRAEVAEWSKCPSLMCPFESRFHDATAELATLREEHQRLKAQLADATTIAEARWSEIWTHVEVVKTLSRQLSTLRSQVQEIVACRSVMTPRPDFTLVKTDLLDRLVSVVREQEDTRVDGQRVVTDSHTASTD